jgi:hypothetical protein
MREESQRNIGNTFPMTDHVYRISPTLEAALKELLYDESEGEAQ